MTARVLRTLVTAAVSAVLMVVAIGSAGTVQAQVSDRAFQAVGCERGDYTCYYAKLGGSPYTYYCQNGYYTCTSGVPNTPEQKTQQDTVQYCGEGGGTGCINGSPLYTNTTPVDATGSGLANGGSYTGKILVSPGFVNVGTSYPARGNTP